MSTGFLTRPRPRFAFIQDDVQAQIDVSKSVVATARRIDQLIETAEPEERKRELRAIRDELLATAGRLADNAKSTSNTAVQVFVSATSS